MINLPQLEGFEWDKGNIEKNWLIHKVDYRECEEIFDNIPLLLLPDKIHSKSESRYRALGKTNSSRYLFIIFTIRNNNIRIISARDMNKKERKKYEQTKKTI